MDILSLELNNFGPLEHAYVNLSGQGLVNIEGDNRDDPSANSNGSGKSTLPDGLQWVLFGTTARGLKGDDVIANFAGKDCYGAVLLQDGDERYMVERWRKKKGFKGKPSGLALSRTGADGIIDLTDGTDALTQTKIESILGCSEEVFTKAVYSGQEALPDLPNMTDKQIKELVEEAAGIEILAQAYQLAREHARDQRGKLDSVIRDRIEAETRLADARSTLERHTTRQSEWSGERDVRAKAKTDELARAVLAAKTTVAAMTAIDADAIKADLSRLRASVSAIDSERAEERRLNDLVSVARSNHASSVGIFDSTMNAVRTAKRRFEQVEAKIGTPCDECGKPHTAEDVADVKRLAGEKLREVTEDARRLKAKVEEDEKELAARTTDLTTFRTTMTDVSSATTEISTLERQLADRNRLNDTLDTQKIAIGRIKGEAEKLSVETNPYTDLVAEAGLQVSSLEDRVREQTASFSEAEKLCEVADAAVKVFGPAGVRAYVLDTVTPYLNERTSHYLGTLSDGRIEAVWTTLARNAKGELSEKFAIEVEKVGGGKTFKALSGGEKRKVRLSCALALQDLVSSRATKPISLWIGDEIDDALDEAGLERLMSVLEEKSREKGSVLVISHNSLRDWIRETTVVTMEGGKSTVTGALC